MSNELELILGPHDKPRTKKSWAIYSIQQVFAMFGSTVLVPILIGMSTGLALLTAGIGTLLYIIATKAKVPVFLGSSFAFLPVAFALPKEQLPIAVAIWGAVYLLVAGLITLTGNGWIKKALPPVVIGPVIIVIGMSLAGVATGSIGLVEGNENYLSAPTIITGLVTFLSAVLVMRLGKGTIKAIPVLIAIVVGYITSIITGLTDISEIGKQIAEAGIFQLPTFNPIWSADWTKFGSILLVVLPLTLVTMAEHIGDHKVISEICDQDFHQDPGLNKTLLGDGLATLFAGIVGGPTNTTYGENTSTVQMSRVGSVYVMGLAAIIAVALAFIAPISIILSNINWAVIGGISLLLFGMIAYNGIKVLVGMGKDALSETSMIIISVMLVVGLGGAIINFTMGDAKFSFSGVALTVIVGIILNGLLNGLLPLILKKTRRNSIQ